MAIINIPIYRRNLFIGNVPENFGCINLIYLLFYVCMTTQLYVD